MNDSIRIDPGDFEPEPDSNPAPSERRLSDRALVAYLLISVLGAVVGAVFLVIGVVQSIVGGIDNEGMPELLISLACLIGSFALLSWLRSVRPELKGN